MRTSALLLATEKEVPADAEIVSHQLMLRAGLIRRLASGLYTWLPTGVRALRKVENIVREEMDRAGALEVFMPAIQPSELWEESGRWTQYGPELLRVKDRHDRPFCVGPTHEEVITDLARRELRSYKQLPVNLYQIQSKFRDEVRPRFGVMRAREFIMKDAYSFDVDIAGAERSYERMREAYIRVFRRTGLDFRIVAADSGSIGGDRSHEFHVLADSGEDAIAFNSTGTYAANVELAEAVDDPTPGTATESMATVSTPGCHTIADVSKLLGIPVERCLKALLVKGEDDKVMMFILRGDHELNLIKCAKIAGVASPVEFSEREAIVAAIGANPGSIGPVGVDPAKVTVVVDRAAAASADFCCGANEDGMHHTGVNWNRDLPLPEVADLRSVVDGDPSPDGEGTLSIARGIEVGHIFYLGTKYSEPMKATVLAESGNATTVEMGCYGIGVTRVVAAAVEQNNDERGIIWPTAIAPYEVALLPMNMKKSTRVRDAAQKLYEALKKRGVDVLFDDRNSRPGVMFADMELLGIPHRLVLGERRLDEGKIEYKRRSDGEELEIDLDEVVEFIKTRIDGELAVDLTLD